MSLENRRLILVSNAEPYAHRWEEDDIKCEKLAGGLTSALDPLMQETGGVWVAWGRGKADFEVLNSEGKVKVPSKDGYDLKRIELNEREIEEFYLGFSNEILWPICHSFPSRAILGEYTSSKKNWCTYCKINERYAEAVTEELEDNDLVWIHDYHLPLTPKIIREKEPEANIAFFWHIPWPPWENFGNLPWREEVIDGLAACDFIGFHTPRLVNNFLACAEKTGKKVNWSEKSVKSNERETKVSSIPISIDYDWFNNMAKKDWIHEEAQKLRDRIQAEKIILSVDRLDYTKGIPERLRAFELFLDENPEFRRKVTLVQRIPPSRISVDEYQRISSKINRIIGRINGKYERADWTPIKSFHRFLSNQEKLIPYYLAADVALVSPLIDGMNLVCKEYVASTNDGVLILSEFAGAAGELEEALHVNPYNTEQMGKSIKKALTMPEKERKSRLQKLKNRIKENDLKNWREKFMKKWLDTT